VFEAPGGPLFWPGIAHGSRGGRLTGVSVF